MPNKKFYTEKELPQRGHDWLKMRETCVGGSDVATILGLMTKYEKPKTLWKREVGKLAKKAENNAMKRGQEMEEEAKKVVIQHLKEVEGIKNPKITPYFAKHPKYEFIGVSFDGVDIKNKFITELKCPKYSSVFKSVFLNGIQEYYYPQVQLQLAVANEIWGIEKAYFASYYPQGAALVDYSTFMERIMTLAVIDVDYDPNYFKEMLKVIKIYRKFVEEKYYDDELMKKATEEFKKYGL